MIISSLVFVCVFVYHSVRNKIVSICVAFGFLVCGICLSYGVYLILEDPFFAPRAFIGFGAFCAIVCIGCVDAGREARFLARNLYDIFLITKFVLIILIAYSCIVFANAYGNAITAQDRYVKFRSELLYMALADLVPDDAKIAFTGSIGYAPPTRHFVDVYGGIARRLIPGYNGWLLHLSLIHLKAPYSNDVYNSWCDTNDEYYKKADSTLIAKNAYQEIYKRGKCYVVTLKP